MQQRMFCAVWLREGEIKKSKLPFPDFATFVACVLIGQEFIQLRNNVFLSAETLPYNTFIRIY
jgi:hypothetical protein